MAFNWDFSFYGGGGALPSMPTGGGDWNYSNIDQLINSIYNPTPTPDTSWESGWDTPTPEGTVDMDWNVPDTNWDMGWGAGETPSWESGWGEDYTPSGV